MTGVDKAKNNISFICKKYYLNNIKSELESTSTYMLVVIGVKKILLKIIFDFVVNLILKIDYYLNFINLNFINVLLILDTLQQGLNLRLKHCQKY